MYYVVAAPKRISPHFKLAPADANVNVNVSSSSSSASSVAPLFDMYLVHRSPSSLIPSGYSNSQPLIAIVFAAFVFVLSCLDS